MEAALSMLPQWLCTLFAYVNSGSPGLRAEDAPRSACTLPQSAPRTHGLLFLLPGTHPQHAGCCPRHMASSRLPRVMQRDVPSAKSGERPPLGPSIGSNPAIIPFS